MKIIFNHVDEKYAPAVEPRVVFTLIGNCVDVAIEKPGEKDGDWEEVGGVLIGGEQLDLAAKALRVDCWNQLARRSGSPKEVVRQPSDEADPQDHEKTDQGDKS